MASLAKVMARSSATDSGGKPPDGGHSLTRQRTHRDILPSALQSPTRDRARDDVSPLVSTTVVEDAALMQMLEIGCAFLYCGPQCHEVIVDEQWVLRQPREKPA